MRSFIFGDRRSCELSSSTSGKEYGNIIGFRRKAAKVFTEVAEKKEEKNKKRIQNVFQRLAFMYIANDVLNRAIRQQCPYITKHLRHSMLSHPYCTYYWQNGVRSALNVRSWESISSLKLRDNIRHFFYSLSLSVFFFSKNGRKISFVLNDDAKVKCV